MKKYRNSDDQWERNQKLNEVFDMPYDYDKLCGFFVDQSCNFKMRSYK